VFVTVSLSDVICCQCCCSGQTGFDAKMLCQSWLHDIFLTIDLEAGVFTLALRI